MTIRPQSERQQTGLENPPIRWVRHYETTDEQYTITNATNATPIVVTTSAEHGFATGDHVIVEDVAGNTAANGTWQVTVEDGTSFSLDGSAGVSSYTGGGVALHAQPVRVKLLRWIYGAPDQPEVYGDPFRVGDLDTPDVVSEGATFFVIWRRDARRWILLSGGGGGGSGVLLYGRSYAGIAAASGYALDEAGDGECELLNDAGEPTTEEPIACKNRYTKPIPGGTPCWFMPYGEYLMLVNADCDQIFQGEES